MVPTQVSSNPHLMPIDTQSTWEMADVLSTLLASFVLEMETFDGLSPKTTRSYVYCLLRIERATGKPITSDPVCSITKADIKTTFAAEKTAPATRYLVLVAAKRWCRWREENGAGRSEVRGLNLPRPRANAPRPLNLKEIATLKDACHKVRHFRLVMFGLYAGCRIAESGAMDEGHWRGDRLRFTGKGDRLREVPLHPELARWHKVVLHGGPVSPASLHNDVEWLRDRVGFYWTAHNLRDTFAQSLIDAEVPLEVVENLLGHSSESMTLRHYARIPWGRKVEAIGRLTY